jgi:hypothetical protein
MLSYYTGNDFTGLDDLLSYINLKTKEAEYDALYSHGPRITGYISRQGYNWVKSKYGSGGSFRQQVLLKLGTYGTALASFQQAAPYFEVRCYETDDDGNRTLVYTYITPKQNVRFSTL